MQPQVNLPVVVIACQVFQHLLEERLPPGLARGVIFLDYGLHRIPRNLKTNVQALIDDLTEPSLVVLGYGLCGNGLNGVRAGRNTLLIPRADDCIAILLGSYQAYQHQFNENPGTYYLSKGWMESGSNPLSEHQEYLAKYGPDKADWIMDQQYQNYKRLVFVAHSREELEQYRPQVLEVARFCQRWDMCYEEIIGSDGYIQRLVEAAASMEKAKEDFILIPPGGELTQAQFIR